MEKINEQNTNKLGKIISFLGIILNVLLAVGKIVVGSIFGLISVVADGLNNLTDCGSSVVSLISFKFSVASRACANPFSLSGVADQPVSKFPFILSSVCPCLTK